MSTNAAGAKSTALENKQTIHLKTAASRQTTSKPCAISAAKRDTLLASVPRRLTKHMPPQVAERARPVPNQKANPTLEPLLLKMHASICVIWNHFPQGRRTANTALLSARLAIAYDSSAWASNMTCQAAHLKNQRLLQPRRNSP